MTANKDTTSEIMNKAGNKIGAEGARALGEALKVNATLTVLNLSGAQHQFGNKQEPAQATKTNRKRNW